MYYYRRDRKEGTRVGGRWHGPGRVLCHEKSSEQVLTNHLGSIVWVSHAGFLLRCSPEQLRPVTQDVQKIDLEVNGPLILKRCIKRCGNNKNFMIWPLKIVRCQHNHQMSVCLGSDAQVKDL